jgi:hypothetical protein
MTKLVFGLAGIEILFGRAFKANIQIEGFYSLLRSEEGLKLNTEVSHIIHLLLLIGSLAH